MRYFYLVLKRCNRNNDDYLVWEETDPEGRILSRTQGKNVKKNTGNWGFKSRKDYEKRNLNKTAFVRNDGISIKMVSYKRHGLSTGKVTLKFEQPNGNTFSKDFYPFKPPALFAFYLENNVSNFASH